MVRTKLDLTLKVLIAALCAGLVWVIYDATREHVVEAGDKAPNFTLTSDQGTKISRSSFGGKVLVLNFWASWCQPCVEETPALNAFAKAFAPSGVVVLGVSVDKNEKQYRQFIQRFHPAFQTARDPEANIAADYGTYKFPETYIIGQDGRVIQKVIGPKNWTDPDTVNFVRSLL